MASPARPAPAPWAARLRPLAVRLTVLAVTVVASAAGAWLGAWWVPFLAGVAAGFLRAAFPGPARAAVAPAVIGATAGWLIPVWVLALRGQPVGATARAIASLAGLPPYAGVALAVTALLAALQVLAGAWLARAVFPPGLLARGPGAGPGQPPVTEDPQT